MNRGTKKTVKERRQAGLQETVLTLSGRTGSRERRALNQHSGVDTATITSASRERRAALSVGGDDLGRDRLRDMVGKANKGQTVGTLRMKPKPWKTSGGS